MVFQENQKSKLQKKSIVRRNLGAMLIMCGLLIMGYIVVVVWNNWRLNKGNDGSVGEAVGEAAEPMQLDTPLQEDNLSSNSWIDDKLNALLEECKAGIKRCEAGIKKGSYIRGIPKKAVDVPTINDIDKMTRWEKIKILKNVCWPMHMRHQEFQELLREEEKEAEAK